MGPGTIGNPIGSLVREDGWILGMELSRRNQFRLCVDFVKVSHGRPSVTDFLRRSPCPLIGSADFVAHFDDDDDDDTDLNQSLVLALWDLASSDELLRKFAEGGSGSKDKATAKKELSQLAKRRRYHRKKITGENDDLVHPAYQSMLGHIRSGTLDRFKDAFHKALNRGDEFSVAAYDCTESFTSLFDEGCAGMTWRKTVDRASKVFLEMHYNWHKRLTNDIA
ncbi:hypothetical protein TEA_011920 [Camellia sinensis var. sinensis]|uniref:Sey1/RHD3-like three-helix bundle domain-containing protein n=1 Tax=Camellia sinensis var. sinensis TaxID=542762 RepID=A0A4S4EKX0_CAMSN|nr:hypothetical protein TEA_011920 [Camellia sinensis var. sinensis]